MPGTLRWIVCLTLACSLAPARAGDPSKGDWASSLRPRDIDGDHVVDAFYDLDLNITWLANANGPGPLLWEDAMAWVFSLTVHGVGGWRLLTLRQVSNCNPSPPPQECFPGIVPGSSELEHMFLTTLGNTQSSAPDLATWNTGPFVGMQPAFYFTDQEAFFSPSFKAPWIFDMGRGVHDIDGDHLPRFAWAVRSGDVFPVPETPSLQLVLAGLALLGAFASRRRHASTSSPASDSQAADGSGTALGMKNASAVLPDDADGSVAYR